MAVQSSSWPLPFLASMGQLCSVSRSTHLLISQRRRQWDTVHREPPGDLQRHHCANSPHVRGLSCQCLLPFLRTQHTSYLHKKIQRRQRHIDLDHTKQSGCKQQVWAAPTIIGKPHGWSSYDSDCLCCQMRGRLHKRARLHYPEKGQALWEWKGLQKASL